MWVDLSVGGVLPMAPWRRRDLCGGRGFSQVGPQSIAGFGVPFFSTQPPGRGSLMSLQLSDSCPRSRAGERGTGRQHEQDLSLGPLVLRVGQRRDVEMTGNG